VGKPGDIYYPSFTVSASVVCPPPNAALKLKSILVVPERHYEAEPSSGLNGGARQQLHDRSLDWQVVKSKRSARAADFPSSAGPSRRRCQRALALPATTPSMDYKRCFHGRCFRCLAKDHKVVHYRDPPRCLNCFGSGHLARRCKAPPDPCRAPFLRPSQPQPKPDIKSRPTFPPGSIHICLTFPDLSYAVVVGPKPTATMVHGARVVAGLPFKRPTQGRATDVAGGAMTSELQKLRRKAVVPITLDPCS
jgi:hypothetical protein